ncbi:DUF1127 domain-containing protein [Mesobacterium pallidum]|uniref:DUF1127 domain-containing protein n=1 Tax=Mesobacterium pallidum TaxID=2872037 RepID=UPI001EE1601C|nr:DUF1127 domain-containing protein [Mesobacterium pallidum]
MAYAATHTTQAVDHSAVYNFFAAIGNALVRMAEANSKLKEMQRLHAMSDDELAKKGMTREDIARHVFSDYYYI